MRTRPGRARNHEATRTRRRSNGRETAIDTTLRTYICRSASGRDSNVAYGAAHRARTERLVICAFCTWRVSDVTPDGDSGDRTKGPVGQYEPRSPTGGDQVG